VRWHSRWLTISTTLFLCTPLRTAKSHWSSFLVTNMQLTKSLYIAALSKYVRRAIIFYIAFMIYQSQLNPVGLLTTVPGSLVSQVSNRSVWTERGKVVGWLQLLQQLRITKACAPVSQTGESSLSTEDTCHVRLERSSSIADEVLLRCSLLADRIWITGMKTSSKA
jgi:hypothetical protein